MAGTASGRPEAVADDEREGEVGPARSSREASEQSGLGCGGACGEYWRRSRGSLRLDVGRPDHLAPLLGFVGDELAEVGGRARKRRAAEVGEPRLDLGIGEAGVDLLVELVDDLGGRVLRRADAEPGARLVARHEFAHGRDVRQRLRARRGRHRQRAQLAGPDVLDRRGMGANMTCTCPPSRSVSAGAAAAIGHVHHVDAGHHLEQLAGHMVHAFRCRPTPC